MNSITFNRCLAQIKTSESAFREIYEYYLPKIKYHLKFRFGDQVDFEDVAHDLFTRLIRMEKPPWVDNPTAWVYKICDNIALDAIKQKSGFTAIDERTAISAQAQVDYERVEENSAFFAVLRNIDSEDAELVKLIIWDGYNIKEAAKIIGVSHGAARQRYSRALKKLKMYLL